MGCGKITKPLKEYFDQLENKKVKILIPGCGNHMKLSIYLITVFFNFCIRFFRAALNNFIKSS